MKRNFILKTLAFAVLFISFSVLTNAQQKDVVYLKNGSIVKGKVIEIIPSQTLKIETADGSLFVFNLSEVEKVTKEEDAPREEVYRERRVGRDRILVVGAKEPQKPQNTIVPKGYFMIAKFGPYIRPLEDATDLSVSFINGAHINEYMSLGVGVDLYSLTYNSNESTSITIVPIYLDTRFYIPGKRVQPMFHIQMGYGSVVNSPGVVTSSSGSLDLIPKKGGLFLAGGAGIRVLLNQKIAFLAEGGLVSQKLKGESLYGTPPEERSQSLVLLRINVGICISFGHADKKSE